MTITSVITEKAIQVVEVEVDGGFTVEQVVDELLVLETVGNGDGSSNSVIQIEKVAGMDLGGHRIVVITTDGHAIYADSHTLAHAHKVIGITTESASTGSLVRIQLSGLLTEPSWSWTLDEPLWAAANGMLTQTPPDSSTGDAFSQIVGTPIAATAAIISIQQPIVL